MTIVSHAHGFVFIRCQKTASTSIELWLSTVLGPEDVITPLSARGEAMRRELGGRAAQNHLGADGRPRFRNHMPAGEIRDLVGAATWDAYFKWCIERNPYDKVISMWCYRHPDPARRPPLERFITSGEARSALNHHLYTIDGEVAVDLLGRYEDLTSELEEVVRRLRLPLRPTDLPRAKARFRTDRRDPFEVLTADQVAAIDRIFAAELALARGRGRDAVPNAGGGHLRGRER